MLIQRISRSDPEKIFVVVRNDDSATASAGQPVSFNFDGTRDGVDVVLTDAAQDVECLAGFVHANIAAGDYGLAQVYGYDSDGIVYMSNTSVSVGDLLYVLTATTALRYSTTSCETAIMGNIIAAESQATPAATATTNSGIFLRLL